MEPIIVSTPRILFVDIFNNDDDLKLVDIDISTGILCSFGSSLKCFPSLYIHV